jgi:tRNA threonylcarbamoyladenosine biosynthesis protein TsaE
MVVFTIGTEQELPAVAHQLLLLAGPKRVWLFEGEMGAGKTTLIKELCKQLGAVSDLSSPTFSIVNEYMTDRKEKIFHFDLYRLKQPRELFDLGFDDYIDSGDYCFIEWPHQVEYDYPAGVFKISIAVNGNVRTLHAE